MNPLRICREYGQPPEWWFGLDADMQALLLADLEVRHERETQR